MSVDSPGPAALPRWATRVLRHLGGLALLFSTVWLVHWQLLHLPYYWDEAGYYIPAAYDFFRSGSLIPYSTLSNAHPPLPSIYLAAWWRVFGFAPFVTRTAMCLVAAIGIAGVYRLAVGAVGDRRAAAAVALLTALYPVWFVQSTLAHADLLAAAGTLWGLCLWLEAPRSDAAECRRLQIAAAMCFVMASLAKEIAIGTPLALGAWELWAARRRSVRPSHSGGTCRREVVSGIPAGGRVESRHASRPAALLLTVPGIPLAGWFAYHRWRTGFVFGNPEYLRYNATATLTPMRVLLALAHRALHLTGHLNLFVPVAVTLGCLLLPRLPGRAGIQSSTRTRLVLVLAANWIFFSVLGGALLTRYLLPLYPLVLLLCVDVWWQRLRRWEPLVLLAAAAFVLGLFVNPPYRFAPEDTLAYRDSILLEQDAIEQIEARYGKPCVLSAWPATDGLTKPELGYVRAPMPVVAMDNFSAQQVELARVSGGTDQPYTVALVFSTKYDPPQTAPTLWSNFSARKRALDEQYFDFHYDLQPETIARVLGGTVVWREQRHGQWAAVLHFDRPQLALLAR